MYYNFQNPEKMFPGCIHHFNKSRHLAEELSFVYIDDVKRGMTRSDCRPILKHRSELSHDRVNFFKIYKLCRGCTVSPDKKN